MTKCKHCGTNGEHYCPSDVARPDAEDQLCRHGVNFKLICPECEARRPMKVLCGNYPVCNDSSCRMDHEMQAVVDAEIERQYPEVTRGHEIWIDHSGLIHD